MRAASITASGIFAVKYVRIMMTLNAPIKRFGTSSATSVLRMWKVCVHIMYEGTRPPENSIVKNR